MDATNLMIGDWVQHCSAVFQVVKIDGEHIYMTDSRGEQEDQPAFRLKPVRITPEILEKNGFWPVDGDRQVFADRKRNYNMVYSFKEDNEFSCENKMNGRRLYIRTDYVHEMQHAMKACKLGGHFVLQD